MTPQSVYIRESGRHQGPNIPIALWHFQLCAEVIVRPRGFDRQDTVDSAIASVEVSPRDLLSWTSDISVVARLMGDSHNGQENDCDSRNITLDRDESREQPLRYFIEELLD